MREVTIRTWLCRGGMQGKKLHDRFLAELELIHVQLDELWANVQKGIQDMWWWVAHDAKTKLIPVLQVGAEVRRWRFQSYTNLKEGWQWVVCQCSARMDYATTFML